MPAPDRIRAVAFDLDGTLVDTAPDLADAVNAALTVLGCRALPEACIAGLIGDGLDRLVTAALTESFGRAPPAGARAAARKLVRRRYAERVFRQSRVYPGVRETLQALHGRGMPLCCLTNKQATFALPLLAAAQLEHLFAFTLCAERAFERKPHPHLLLAACARLHIAPPQLLYVGDSRNDVQAARAAGSPVAVVRYGYGRGVPDGSDEGDWSLDCLTEIIALTRHDAAMQPLTGGLHAR